MCLPLYLDGVELELTFVNTPIEWRANVTICSIDQWINGFKGFRKRSLLPKIAARSEAIRLLTIASF